MTALVLVLVLLMLLVLLLVLEMGSASFSACARSPCSLDKKKNDAGYIKDFKKSDSVELNEYSGCLVSWEVWVRTSDFKVVWPFRENSLSKSS